MPEKLFNSPQYPEGISNQQEFLRKYRRIGTTGRYYRVANSYSIGNVKQNLMYEGWDLQAGRPVMLKMSICSFSSLAEARMASNAYASRNAVINIYDVEQVSDHELHMYINAQLLKQKNREFWIIMEYLNPKEWKTLGELIKTNSLDREKLIFISNRLAAVVDETYIRGFLHKDIKPENVMVRLSYDKKVGGKSDEKSSWMLQLIDFGIAIPRGQENANEGVSTIIKGSPVYLSPERVRGVSMDLRSEVFSFGIIIYEMLLGTLPFEAETLQTTLLSIAIDSGWIINLERYCQTVCQFDTETTANFLAVFKKILHKRSSSRYDTLTEAFNALLPYFERMPTQLRRSLPTSSKHSYSQLTHND